MAFTGYGRPDGQIRHIEGGDHDEMSEERDDARPPSEPAPYRLDRAALRARKPDRHTFRDAPRAPVVLVLDGVQGNYNKGAIFRLCDAFLIEHLHLCHTTLEHWGRRFAKAARGTYHWVPHTVGEDTLEVVRHYQTQGYQVVVTEQCTGSVPVWEAALAAPVCIVLGSEMEGVSPAVVAVADQIVELPTMGMANSLNVSMSAAMLVMSAFRSLAGAANEDAS